jgi:hypothetical protein
MLGSARREPTKILAHPGCIFPHARTDVPTARICRPTKSSASDATRIISDDGAWRAHPKLDARPAHQATSRARARLEMWAASFNQLKGQLFAQAHGRRRRRKGSTDSGRDVVFTEAYGHPLGSVPDGSRLQPKQSSDRMAEMAGIWISKVKGDIRQAVVGVGMIQEAPRALPRTQRTKRYFCLILEQVEKPRCR